MGLGESMKPWMALPERVWMEKLEGRVLLSGETQLDLSHPNDISGSGKSTFSFEATAGVRYLFIELEYNDFTLYNSEHQQIAVSQENMVSRLSWKAPHSGTYYLWLDDDASDSYELIARKWSDDFGDDPESATLLREGQPIHGEIEDVSDEDVFEFHGQAGVRYAFNPHSSAVGPWVSDDHGRDANIGSDGTVPLPYSGTYYIHVSTDWTVGAYDLTAWQVSDDLPAELEIAVH